MEPLYPGDDNSRTGDSRSARSLCETSARGDPLWYSMPLAKGEDETYSGPIVFATGPSYDDALYDASQVRAMAVGSAAVSFDGRNNARLEYSLPGLYSGTRDIARQVFDQSAEAGTCD